MTILYTIKDRHGCPLWRGDIEAPKDTPEGIKLGLAVRAALARGVILSEAILSEAILDGANMSHARLRGAILNRAYLSGADLGGADMTCAYLGGADLNGADMNGADMTCANLSGADLGGADMTCANLKNAILDRCNLRSANLHRVKNLLILGPSMTDRLWYAVRHDSGPMIQAGCQWFGLDEAREHWKLTRAGTKIGDERQRWLDFIEAWA